MGSAIFSIGTAVPATVVHQHQLRDLFRGQPGTSRLTSRLIGAAFDASAIDTRHTVIAEFDGAAALSHERVFLSGPLPHPGEQLKNTAQPGETAQPGDTAQPDNTAQPRVLVPSTSAREAVYREEAPRLARRAAERALAALPRLDRRQVTHVVTVSCTGFTSPGLDVDLIRHLGLQDDTKRLHVGFLGCYAAFPALQHARAVCESDPTAVVLVVSIELCSLHVRVSAERDSITSSTVFADGAAAAIVAHTSTNLGGPHLEIAAMRTALLDGAEHMSWRIGDHGYDMVLGAQVPKLLGQSIAETLEPLRRDHPELVPGTWNDVEWAVHPGGRSILDEIERALNLSPPRLEASREVLRTYGNMSSATVLFILAKYLRRYTEADDADSSDSSDSSHSVEGTDSAEGPDGAGGTGNTRGAQDASDPGTAAHHTRTICATAFGPGLTVESALFVAHPGAAE